MDGIEAAQLASLDDTDCYATAWTTALQHKGGKWGGRGEGGRGRARRTFQPFDVILDNISLEYVGSKRKLLNNASLRLLSGKVYALLGRNGSGKSTFLRRLHARKVPGFPPQISILYLPPAVSETELSCSPIDFLRKYSMSSVLRLEEDLRKTEEQMENLDIESENGQSRIERLVEDCERLQEEIDGLNSTMVDDIQEALMAVGLNDCDSFKKPMHNLTSGQRKRVLLAAIKVCPCNLVLLDEPATSLDVRGLLLLRDLIEGCVDSGNVTVLLVSHDEDLLDDVTDQVVDIVDESLNSFSGNTSEYRSFRKQNTLQDIRRIIAHQKKQTAMTKTLSNLTRQPVPKRGGNGRKAKIIGSYKKKMERVGISTDQGRNGRRHGDRVSNSKMIDSSTRRGLSLLTFAEMTEKAVEPPPDKAIQFLFKNCSSRWDEPLIVACDVGISFGETTLFNNLDITIEEGRRYCILGGCASGKNTLLNILAGVETSYEGKLTVASGVSIAMISVRFVDDLLKGSEALNSISLLCERFPKQSEDEIRGELTAFGISKLQAETDIRFLSSGERMRLAMACCMLKRPHIVLMEDPTACLDLESVRALSYGLKKWNGTVVFSGHDTSFIRSLDPDCLVIDSLVKQVRLVSGGIDEYLQSFRG